MSTLSQIVIGDELLSGKIDDLNMKFLAKFLLDKPIQFVNSYFVRDDEDTIKNTIDHAFTTSDIILITGGLGPTEDDITKKVLCDYFKTTLEERNNIKKDLMDKYRFLGKDWELSISNYHKFPKNAEYILNPKGLAPGIMFKNEVDGQKKILIASPGVPREFQVMLEEEIYPQLKVSLSLESDEQEYMHIRTHGIPEEEIFNIRYPKLWKELEKYAKVSSLPTLTGVDISLRIKRDVDLQNNKDSILKIIHSTDLPKSIWHIGPESLAEVIVQKAKEKNITIGFAESCTGGLSASKITDISGSSSVFIGSITAYANEVKMNILRVKEQTLIKYGAVSKQTAFEMASGARKQLNVDISISWTGIAGPGGGSDEKPVGSLGIGISTKEKTSSKMYQFKGDRLRLKEKFSNHGLLLLLKEIENFN